MSRIGKQPIMIPKGVDVKVSGQMVSVKGPKGQLSRKFHNTVTVSVAGDTANVQLKKADDLVSRRYHGLSRTVLSNMLEGCLNGYTKTLTLVGVGYRAAQKGKGVSLNVGLSHQVDFDPPAGIDIKVDKQTNIIIAGAEKELVGMVAAKLRAFRPPEPYHGKGIRYLDEVISTKVGKASGKK